MNKKSCINQNIISGQNISPKFPPAGLMQVAGEEEEWEWVDEPVHHPPQPHPLQLHQWSHGCQDSAETQSETREGQTMENKWTRINCVTIRFSLGKGWKKYWNTPLMLGIPIKKKKTGAKNTGYCLNTTITQTNLFVP